MKSNRNKLIESVLFIVGVLCFSTVFAADDPPETTHDGLVLVKGSKAAVAYKHPQADFSGYNKIIILEPYIAFKKDWKRDQNRSRTGVSGRVSDKDMERMISRGKDLFEHVFTDVLEEGGYPIVKEAGEDVLLVRPAIIELDIAAPDLRSAGRTRTYVASAGSAVIFVELYDSVTGQILARAFDGKAARDNNVTWGMTSSSVSNTAAATRGLKYWAGLLKDALDRAKKQ